MNRRRAASDRRLASFRWLRVRRTSVLILAVGAVVASVSGTVGTSVGAKDATPPSCRLALETARHTSVVTLEATGLAQSARFKVDWVTPKGAFRQDGFSNDRGVLHTAVQEVSHASGYYAASVSAVSDRRGASPASCHTVVAAVHSATAPSTALPTPSAPSSASPTSLPTSSASGSAPLLPRAPGAPRQAPPRPPVTNQPSAPPTNRGGWPGRANTGVPAGTSLTPYTGSQTITVAGTIIDGKRIVNGCLDIQANNVTIRNSVISGIGCWAAIRPDGGNGLLIQDTEIDGTGTTGTGGNAGDDFGIAQHQGSYTCVRCNVHGVGVAYTANGSGAVSIQDSWGWGLVASPSSHNQVFLSNGTTSGVTLRHNRFDNPLRQTATISLFGDFSPIQNVTVDNNLLNGGDFCVYGGYDPTKAYGTQDRNVRFTNNHFMRTPEAGAFYSSCALFGPVTAFDTAGPGNVWSGNIWDDTGDLVPPQG